MNPETERRQRNIESNARWRWIFLGMAVVIPLGLGGLFQRQTNRLRALADHGQPTTATVTGHTTQGSSSYTEYQYQIHGVTHEWSVTRRLAPYELGASFPITYLPEVPSLSRPVVNSQVA